MIGAVPLRMKHGIDRADSEASSLTSDSNREIVQVVAGDFEVRLAQTVAEIDAAQALR